MVSEICTFPAALMASWMLASMKMSLESLYPEAAQHSQHHSVCGREIQTFGADSEVVAAAGCCRGSSGGRHPRREGREVRRGDGQGGTDRMCRY